MNHQLQGYVLNVSESVSQKGGLKVEVNKRNLVSLCVIFKGTGINCNVNNVILNITLMIMFNHWFSK